MRRKALGPAALDECLSASSACGAGGCLLAGTRRCQLGRQLGELLAHPGGQVRPELQVLHDTLASAQRPDTGLNWLKRAATRIVLAELATGQHPLGHAALDDLTPGKPIEHLRSCRLTCNDPRMKEINPAWELKIIVRVLPTKRG